jgi:opacity protein-like surface antigen
VSFYSLTFRYDSSSYLFTDNSIGSLKYLRIPWQLNYKFSYNKFSPYIALGVTTNLRFDYITGNKQLVDMVTKTYNYKDGISDFQIGLDAGLGFRYSISPKTSVSIKFDYEHAYRFFGRLISDKSFNSNGIIEASFFYRLK